MKQLSLSLILCLLFAASAHPQSIIEAIEMTANGAGPIVSGPVGFDVTTAPPGATSYSADWYRDVATGAGSVLGLPGGMQVAGGFYFVTAGLSGTNVAADHNTALNRWTRNGLTNALIEGDIYEMRFTAGPNQGWLFFGGNVAIPLPFEVWNLGEDPVDTSDDYRMVPAIAEFDGTGAFDFRHDAQIDPDVNDPVSDWIYFRNPVDTSPGDAGYNKAFPAPNTRDANEIGPEIMGRIVLMNYNQLQGGGGVNEMPEVGTVIRIHGGNLPPTCQPDVPNGKVWFKDGIGLQSISVVSSLNANITINPLTPGDELASADVSRIDTSVDGYVAFNVVDTGGLSRECIVALNNDEMIPHTVGNVGLGVHDNSTLGPMAGGPSVPDVSGTWPSPGGANHIFAAGLWIGAEVAGEKRVLDGGYSNIGDWSKIAGITMTEFNDGAQQIINTTYDDRYAGLAFPPFDRATTPVGLEVDQHSYSWSDPDRDDFVIITYDIENKGASGDLTNLLVALWADPDVGASNVNEAGYDASRGLLWVTQAGGGTSYVGFKVLSGPPHAAFAPTNSAGGACSAYDSDDVDQYDRFLNGGLPVLCPYPSDVKTSLTAQPFDLVSGERNRIGFGMVFGADLTDLQTNADEMQSVYDLEVGPIAVTVREINALHPDSLAKLEANSPPLTLDDITRLTRSSYSGKAVKFTAVVLTEPHNSGLANTYPDGQPHRIHVFVRDISAASMGFDGMSIQLVDSDYNTTGLINVDPGDVIDVVASVQPFNQTIQLSPLSIVDHGPFAGLGLPASIVAPDTVATADLHVNTGAGNRIDWNNFVRYNSGYVRIENAEVTAVDGDVDRPHWLMTTDGGTTSIAKDDFSLRFRTGADYQPPFNKRSGPYTPPPVGANTNIQGFLTFRGHDPFGTGDPAQAVFSISPWKDSDVSIVQSVVIADVPNPPPVALPEVGLNIDFSSVEGAATVTVEQFTEEPDDLPGVFIPELGLFWTIDIDGATSFSTELCFSLSGLDPATDPTTLQVLKRDESGEPWAQQNTTLKPNAINPTEICVSGITSFSDFAIGSFHPEGGGGGDISPYLLLASDTIAIGLVTSVEGDLHSNGSILISEGPATYTSNLSAVAEISVGPDNTVDGDAIAGGMITLGANSVVSGSVSEFDTVEPVPLPGLSFSSGGNDVSVPKSGSLLLPPGSYGTVEIATDGTLRVSAGTYRLSELILARRAVVEVNQAAGPVTINVTDTLVVDAEVSTDLSLGPAGAPFVTLNVSDANVVGIGKQTTMHLLLNAPGSVVMLDKETEWVGTIAARTILGDKDLRLTHPSALEPTDALAKGHVDADGVEDELPQAYSLEQNYPNPFNPTTTIGFDLPEASFVRLSVFDVLGREVNPLIARELKAGRHQVIFDASSLSSGTYLYRIEAGPFVQTRRMIVVK